MKKVALMSVFFTGLALSRYANANTYLVDLYPNSPTTFTAGAPTTIGSSLSIDSGTTIYYSYNAQYVSGATTMTGPPPTYGTISALGIILMARSATGMTGISNQAPTSSLSSYSGGITSNGRTTSIDLIFTGVNGDTTYSLSDLRIWTGSAPVLGPTAVDTQASVSALASNLRGGFSGQAVATNFANMNTYDCNLFDAKGMCVSVGGQQSYVDSPSSNTTSSVLVVGYKVSPTFRIGGFLNQNLNNHTSSSVDISNANPLMGLFAVWNQNENHLGYQVKIANAYQDKDIKTIRETVGTSEAGKGSTELNTQSYVGELSYAFLANHDKTIVRPYAAVRYTRIKQDGYSETGVSNPLTYSALSDRSTTSLVGVKLNHKLADKVNLTGSLGVEQDLYHHVSDLRVTGVSGLTSESFNDNIKRTRPVASIGAYYTPAKNQRIAGEIFYQQLPFQSTASTTAYVNYMIGF